VLRPVTVIEIGTERGISSLAMKAALPVGAKIHTFDIAPYHQMKNPVLLQRDLDDSLIQHVADLTRTETQQQFTRLFEEADFIFMDAAKDGQMERVFLQFFDSLSFKRKPVLMMDDIHNWNMLAIWRAIERPKLDVSSFAHFTGTGLVLL
jgi:predicted O-methyltransferase YrrM